MTQIIGDSNVNRNTVIAFSTFKFHLIYWVIVPLGGTNVHFYESSHIVLWTYHSSERQFIGTRIRRSCSLIVHSNPVDSYICRFTIDCTDVFSFLNGEKPNSRAREVNSRRCERYQCISTRRMRVGREIGLVRANVVSSSSVGSARVGRGALSGLPARFNVIWSACILPCFPITYSVCTSSPSRRIYYTFSLGRVDE